MTTPNASGPTKSGCAETQPAEIRSECAPVRVLTPEAQRALAEADARRKLAAGQAAAAHEVGGRDGPDPVRFGDWEKGGIASDF